MATNQSKNLNLTIEDNNEFIGVETSADNFRIIDEAFGKIDEKIKGATQKLSVNVTQNGSTVSAEKTLEEIKAANENGTDVVVLFSSGEKAKGTRMELSEISDTGAVFFGCTGSTIWKISCTASGWNVAEFIPAESSHEHSIATQNANGFLAASDKKKIDSIADGANKTTTDSSLSETSTNPVQNKVIKAALDGKAGTSHTHSVATQTANGFMAASDKKKLDEMVAGGNQPTVDSSLSETSTNPVQNKVIKKALDGKAATSHTHSGYASTSHTHGISDVTNLQSTLNGKASTSHTHSISDVTNLQNTLNGKASTSHTHSGYASTSHTHSISDVSNLQNTLNGKAATSHTHYPADVAGLTENLLNLSNVLDDKAEKSGEKIQFDVSNAFEVLINGSEMFTVYAQDSGNTAATCKPIANISLSGAAYKPVYINPSNGVLGMLSSSSARYKKGVSEELSEEIDPHRLYKLPVVEFVYKDGYLQDDDPLCGKKIIGFVAENVKNIYPISAVVDSNGNAESWNERYMLPGMLKLIQEQHEQIEKLEARLSEVEKQIAKATMGETT